jgi:hypothetical protein
MKNLPFAALLITTLLLSACSLPGAGSATATATAPVEISSAIPFPTSTNPQVATSAPTAVTGTAYDQSGVSFTLPSCLAAQAIVSTLAAVPPDPNGAPVEFAPEQRVIKFSGYPLSGKFFEPEIHIFPVAAFVQMRTDLQQEVDGLKELLSTHPDALPESIPLLPPQYAAQVFHTRESYLDFQNGSGIAFLTEYAQYAAPADNQDLFYTYQGLTRDGLYWVSAFLPANIAFLQNSPTSTSVPIEGIPMPDPNASDFSAKLPGYYSAVTGLMNSASASAYTPDLNCLDAFLQSLKVAAP